MAKGKKKEKEATSVYRFKTKPRHREAARLCWGHRGQPVLSRELKAQGLPATQSGVLIDPAGVLITDTGSAQGDVAWNT